MSVERSIKAPMWCGWPHDEFATELDSISRMGARCDAWRAFMQSETLAELKKVKGHFIHFSEHDSFERLIASFDCSEETLRATLARLLRPRFRKQTYAFKRIDIYDARAWAYLPLNWFIPCDEREIPTLQVAINLPLRLKRSDFFTKRTSKDRKPVIDMFVAFDGLGGNHHSFFSKGRWVASVPIEPGKKRADYVSALFAKVEENSQRHQFIIEDVGEPGDTDELARTKKRDEERELLRQWRAGKIDRFTDLSYHDRGLQLRARNGRCETSGGQSCALDDARRVCLWAIACWKKIRSEKGATCPLGPSDGRVVHIEWGAVKIGCQTFPRKLIEEFAASQGWIPEPRTSVSGTREAVPA